MKLLVCTTQQPLQQLQPPQQQLQQPPQQLQPQQLQVIFNLSC